MTLTVQIGSDDLGPAGGDGTVSLTMQAGGASGAGSGKLGLLKDAGGGYAFLNKAEVAVFDKTAGGTYGRVARTFFGGYLDRAETGQIAGSTLKRWALDVTDENCQLSALVSDAPQSTALHLASGSFPDQLRDACDYWTSGAANGIDGVSGVLDLFPGLTLPAIVYPDMTLGEILQDICDRAVAATPHTTVVPRFCVRPDTAPNRLILDPDHPLGPPILWVWDGAAPQGPVMAFSDNPTGSERSISSVVAPRRVLDSAGLVQRRALTVPETGLLYLGELAASIATYPNPADGRHGAWAGKSIKAPRYLAPTAAQAYIDTDVGKSAYPLETLYLTSDNADDQPPLPGQTVTVTWALLGLSAVPYEVAATSYVFWWSASDGLRVRITLTLGLAQRALGQPGRFGGVRVPVIAVPPDAPSGLAATSSFSGAIGQALNTYSWTLPGNLDGISGYVIYETTPAPGGPAYRHTIGGAVTTSLTTYVNPGNTFSAIVRAVGVNGLESVDSNTYGPFTSTAAWDPLPPSGLTDVAHADRGFVLRVTAPATTQGPHSLYEIRVVGGGQTQTLDYADPGGSTPQFPINNLTPGVTYTVDARCISQPGAYYGTVYSSPISVTLGGDYKPPPDTPGGGTPMVDAPLFPYTQSAGTALFTRATTGGMDGASAYSVTTTGADGPALLGLAFATAAGAVWTIRSAAKHTSGAPNWTGVVEWDDGSNAWVLTASTLTLPAVTGSWPGYTEQQVKAPATALWGRLRYTVATLAAAVVLLSIPSPSAGKTVADLDLGTSGSSPFIIKDLSDGSAQLGLYASGAYNGVLQGLDPARDRLRIATASTSLELGAAGLTVGGAENHATRSVTNNDTFTAADHTIRGNATGGALTLTLPAIGADSAGREYRAVKTDASANTITVTANGADTIIGAATYVLSSRYSSVLIEADGTHTWYVYGSH